MTLNDYIDRFARLREEMHVHKGLEGNERPSPHKVCMLLAVMDMVRDNRLAGNRIPYNQELKEAFTFRFEQMRVGNDANKPFAPFYYLQTADRAFWHHKIREGKEVEYRKFHRSNSDKLLRESVEYAFLDRELFECFRSPKARETLMMALLGNLNEEQKARILVPQSGWSWSDCDALVTEYLKRLKHQLARKEYNTEQADLVLMESLQMSQREIETVRQHITAILMEAGIPTVDGYAPLPNYQREILPDVVGVQIADLSEIEDIIERASRAPARRHPQGLEILKCEVEYPSLPPVRKAGKARRQQRYSPPKFDFIEREQKNRALGLRGERFVVEYEKQRLKAAGKTKLAKSVVHSSQQNDGLGYDIRSFDDNEAPRYIEVKTTNHARDTKFWVTRNEVEVSRELGEQYHLYRVFAFNRDPRFFARKGDLAVAFDLESTEYIADPRGQDA